MLTSVGIYILPYSIECLNNNLLHLRNEVLLNIDAALAVLLINELLEMLER